MRQTQGRQSPASVDDDERTTITSMSSLQSERERAGRDSSIHGIDLVVGREDEFIVAWGRANAALQSKERSLVFSMLLNVVLVVLIGCGGWWALKRKTLALVRDSEGNVVLQADADALAQAANRRAPDEFKAFLRRWVVDAFSWTPVDVEDRIKASLRFVDKSVHGLAKEGLRLAERAKQVEQGMSGGVYEDGGRDPQAVIMAVAPLEVVVSLQRYLVDRSGVRTDAPPLLVRARLREVPRSSMNGHGLMIVDLRVSSKL